MVNNILPLFCHFLGFNLSPMFPPVGSEMQQASGAQASPDQQPDPNMSLKTEYMSFPPPLQRTPLNNAHTRYSVSMKSLIYSQRFPLITHSLLSVSLVSLSSQDDSKNSSWLNSSLNRSCDKRGGDRGRPDSHDSLSSVPDRIDPSTVTKSFRPGRKASAQASLASRDKTPKNRRWRAKNHNNTGEEEIKHSNTSKYKYLT